MPTRRLAFLPGLLACLLLAGCPSSDFENFGNSGGGGDGGGGSDLLGDDARRAVLADIGEDIILPSLQDFAEQADRLSATVAMHAEAPRDDQALATARDAWREAMVSWQRNEVLQVGPLGRSVGLDTTPGGANLRGQIYSFPFRTPCEIDRAALEDREVNENTGINIRGLGAIEYLLFFEGPNPDCPPPAEADLVSKRAQHAQRLASFIASVADDLVNRWAPSGGNFLAVWSTAGAGSNVYMRPQDALDALSVALFYVEKDTKDDKIADPTGIGATGLTPCPTASCPERLESQLSMTSGSNIRSNVQAFRDVFTGVDGGMGVNDLLRGIGRDDLADDLITELDATLEQLAALDPNFDVAVADIPDANQCMNASANRTGLPVCALHGDITAAMDIFRGPIVSTLSLATPNRAAGDND